MLSDTYLKLPIETVDWEKLDPTYPFRFNGPGYLYCRWCTHYIRLVCHTKTGVSCSDCGQALASAPQPLMYEPFSLTEADLMSNHV